MEYLFRQKDTYDDSTALIRFQGESIIEIITKFREFLLAAGYHPNTVDKYVPDPYHIKACFADEPDSEGGEE